MEQENVVEVIYMPLCLEVLLNLKNRKGELITKIEKILEQEFGKKYNVISTDIISWEIIKKEFNSKTKKYEYIEEKSKLNDIFENNKEQNEIENLFNNEIEYN